MEDKNIELVSRSYGHCCTREGFFDDFYNNFFSLSDEIVKKFEKTDITKQKKLLRNGLGHVIMSFKGSPISVMKMKQMAKSHSRKELDIPPRLYPFWTKALLQSIEKHDLELNDETRQAWKVVIEKAISGFVAEYN